MLIFAFDNLIIIGIINNNKIHKVPVASTDDKGYYWNRSKGTFSVVIML